MQLWYNLRMRIRTAISIDLLLVLSVEIDCWAFVFVCFSLVTVSLYCIGTIHFFIFRWILVLIVREFYG